MTKATLSPIKLSDDEKIVIDAIEKNGQYVWGITNSHMKRVLKELMWKELIQRKKDKGLEINVFIAGWFFNMVTKHNNAVESLNKF